MPTHFSADITHCDDVFWGTRALLLFSQNCQLRPCAAYASVSPFDITCPECRQQQCMAVGRAE